jgi:hypothetical protein
MRPSSATRPTVNKAADYQNHYLIAYIRLGERVH